MQLREKIINTLEQIIDPETGMDVISMGLIKNIDISEDMDVTVDFMPSSPVCPLVFHLAFDIRDSIRSLNGIKSLDVRVTGHDMSEEVNRMLKEGEK